MAGNQEIEAEHARKGCELLGRAGTAPIGCDQDRLNASHDQPGREPRDCQCLAGPGRADKQKRRVAGLDWDFGERQGVGQRLLKIASHET